MKVLTAEQMEFYEENGYIIIEDFISPDELTTLTGALDRLIEEKAKNLTKDEAGFNLQTVQDEGGQVNNFGGKIVAPGLLRKIQGITRDPIIGVKMGLNMTNRIARVLLTANWAATSERIRHRSSGSSNKASTS